jgi:hypothetical protein
MSESADTRITSLEDLLRDLAAIPLAQRHPVEAPRDASDFGRSSIFAAVVALMIFVPGCAASAIFLLQSDDAIALPAHPPGSEPVLTKSDRLPPFAQPLEPVHGFDSHALVPADAGPMSARDTPQGIAHLDSLAIRGRIEELTVASTSESVVQEAEKATVAPPRPKAKRRLARVKAPKLVAEILPEPEPPSLLQRLFGLRTL